MPTERELTHGKIIRDTVGLGAQLKLAKKKLDNLGYIKSHSGIQNYKERLKRLKFGPVVSNHGNFQKHCYLP